MTTLYRFLPSLPLLTPVNLSLFHNFKLGLRWIPRLHILGKINGVTRKSPPIPLACPRVITSSLNSDSRLSSNYSAVPDVGYP